MLKIRTRSISQLKSRQLILVLAITTFSYSCISYLLSMMAPYENNDKNSETSGFVRFATWSTQEEHTDSSSQTDPRSHPHKNIFFLKIHKSASSTVQNILLRYGAQNDLNFVLPYSYNYLGHPEPFEASMALPFSWNASPDIFCHHTRFKQSSIEEFMPPDTIYLAIVRDPTLLFESLFSYYDLAKHYQMQLEQLLNMPMWWLHTSDRLFRRMGLNQIAFDFGIDETDFVDTRKVRATLEELDRRFDLVLIAEHFDESLVLMRHLLKLRVQDVVYVPHNERRGSARINLTAAMRQKIRVANHVDQLIYDHFLSVFRERVRTFGEDRMAQEVKELRAWNRYWSRVCRVTKLERDDDVLEPDFRPFGDKVRGISVRTGVNSSNSDFCTSLAKTEMPFTKALRSRHIHRHGNWWQQFLYMIRYYKL